LTLLFPGLNLARPVNENAFGPADPLDQASPDDKPSHPSEAKPGRNDIVVSTMHYGLKRMIFEKDVPVAVRDGTVLYVNVFRPPVEGRYPVVVSFDPYGKDSIHMASGMPAGGPYTLGQYNASPFAAWEAPDPGFWVPNDYVVVKAAARGTSGSKGKISPLSQMETEDFFDVIEWCGTQAWSSGGVVANGVSYLAMTQWRVGQLNPPHLKAMIPWEGISDLYREWAFRGGIPETSFCPFLDSLLKKSWPDSEVEELALARQSHPFLDTYWEGRHGNLADIRVPILVCASWSTHGLHNRGTIEGFRQASSAHKWLEIHGRKEWETYFHREALERQLRFCDYFLKGIDNDWLATPRVRYELRERFYDGHTKFADAWPLPNTRYVPFYLDVPNRALVRPRPPQAHAFIYDSAKANTAQGSAVFTLRFAEDTELTGYMKLRLWVAAEEGDDMDLFVGVKKFDRRGRELHFPDFNHIEHGRVARGWLRVSHRELDEARSSPHQPWLKHRRALKLAPGEIVPVDIEIWPSSTLFRKDETLEVTVQGGDFSHTRSNPLPLKHGRISTGFADTVNRGRHAIHAGGQYNSHLLVPVIPPTA
jgi:predicted acyl esterase